MKPVFAVYSTFLQRAYDQVCHDVCLQNLPVVFALDRAGVVGSDGPTHHGVFDLSYLRHLPNITLMAPKDENELQHMIKTALELDGPVAVRYPRGNGYGVPLDQTLTTLPVGKGELLRNGPDGVIFALGVMVRPALEAAGILAAEGIEVAVVNARFVKPLDRELLLSQALTTRRVLTVEENAVQGGFGTAVLELLEEERVTGIAIRCLGYPDCYIEQGEQPELRSAFGLDAAGIASAFHSLAGKSVSSDADHCPT
jgi:1-deoxy-D-xylulose-5-phosphate synthase